LNESSEALKGAFDMSIHFSKSGGAMVMTKHHTMRLPAIPIHMQQVKHSITQFWHSTSENRGERALKQSKAELLIDQCRCSDAQTEFSIYSNRIIK